MNGINITSTTEGTALVLLILYPVLLWIAYKLDAIYREKKNANYRKDINKMLRQNKF